MILPGSGNTIVKILPEMCFLFMSFLWLKDNQLLVMVIFMSYPWCIF